MHVVDVETLKRGIAPLDLLEPTRAAFIAVSCGQIRTTVDVLDLDDGDVHVKAASERGGEVYVVKLASLIPSNRDRDMPTGGGAIVVCSAVNGKPLALLVDNHYITDARTAVAGALASDLMSRPSATCAAVLGSGMQARLQATTLAGLRPLERVVVWARGSAAAEATADALRAELPGSPDVTVAATVRDATELAEILITTTASEEPLVEADWLRPGQHVTAIGADDHRKHELTSECFARADRIVVDLRVQTCAKAELALALERGAVNIDDIVEVGEVLADADLGRRNEEEITIAKLTGLAAQDLAAAKFAAQRLELSL